MELETSKHASGNRAVTGPDQNLSSRVFADVPKPEHD